MVTQSIRSRIVAESRCGARTGSDSRDDCVDVRCRSKCCICGIAGSLGGRTTSTRCRGRDRGEVECGHVLVERVRVVVDGCRVPVATKALVVETRGTGLLIAKTRRRTGRQVLVVLREIDRAIEVLRVAALKGVVVVLLGRGIVENRLSTESLEFTVLLCIGLAQLLGDALVGVFGVVIVVVDGTQ